MAPRSRNHVLQRIPPDFGLALDRQVGYVRVDAVDEEDREIEWNYPLGDLHAAIEDVDAAAVASVDEDVELRTAFEDLRVKFNLLLAHFRERKIIEE